MIYFLKKEHFESMHEQVECKEHDKISLKSVSKLTDILTYNLTKSMSKHICDFKSYLSSHYTANELLVRLMFLLVNWKLFIFTYRIAKSESNQPLNRWSDHFFSFLTNS